MKRRPFLKSTLAASALLLSGCLAQSQIQAKYMNREADCREEAQRRSNRRRQLFSRRAFAQIHLVSVSLQRGNRRRF